MTPATLALQTAHGGKFTVITIFEISALERQPKKLPMQLMIFFPNETTMCAATLLQTNPNTTYFCPQSAGKKCSDV